MQIREHGIYERRDGVIVAWVKTDKSTFCDFPFNVGGELYIADGRFSEVREDPRDLIREIVVGPGWLPWNGVGNPAPDKHVEVAWRNGNVRGIFWTQELDWAHTGIGTDILAYRIVKQTEEPRTGFSHASFTIDTSIKDEGLGKQPVYDQITIKVLANGGYLAVDPDQPWMNGAGFTSKPDLIEWLKANLK